MTTFTVKNERVANAVDLTIYTSSSSVDISTLSGYAVHSIWTGTPTGTIAIQGSNDNSNFATISTVSTGGAASQSMFNVEKAQYNYVRISFTYVSGAGTLTAYISGKSV